MARRFRFRLDPVLDARRRTEEERARILALANRELARATAARDDLVTGRDALRDDIVREHKAYDVERLRATYAHLRWLDGEIRSAEERVEACAAVAERERQRLIEASRERQVLTKLRERRQSAYREETARLEQREIDDLNARAHERAREPLENQGAPS